MKYLVRNLIRGLLMAALGLSLLLAANPTPAQGPGLHAVYLPAIVAQYEPPWEWTENPPVTLAPTPARLMASLDAQGRLHLFWDTYTIPRYIYTTMLSEGAWSAPQPVARSLGAASLASLPYFTASGAGYLAWRAYYGASGNPDYRVWFAEFDGQSWGSAQSIYATDYSATTGLPRIDQRGQLSVLAIDGTVSTITAHQLLRTSTGWTDSGPIHPSGWYGDAWPDLSGGIRFYHTDLYDNLYFAYWLAGEFLADGYFGQGRLWGRSSQLDGDDNLHVYWTDTVPVPGDTVRGVIAQCLAKTLNWGPVRVLSGYNTVVGAIAIANNHAGQFALGWEEVESRRFRLAVLDGCQLYRMRSVPALDPITYSTATLALAPTVGQLCFVAKNDYTQDYASQCTAID